MDIKSKITKNNLLGYGSNRIVFDLNDGTVLKIPYNNIGIESNKLEYKYYNKKPEIVAKVYNYKNNLIIQEKLDNIITVPYEHTLKMTVSSYLKDNGIEIEENILKEMLNTKVQLGKDKLGNYKFFDYEDAKLSENYIVEPFRMTDEWLEAFWDYIKEYDIEKIEKWETFEDHRGFLLDYQNK